MDEFSQTLKQIEKKYDITKLQIRKIMGYLERKRSKSALAKNQLC